MEPLDKHRLFGKGKEIIQDHLQCTIDVQCDYCLHQHPEAPPAKTIFGMDYQGFDLAYCNHCGLKFLSVRPDQEQLFNEVYSEYWVREAPSPDYLAMWTADCQSQIRHLKTFLSPDHENPPALMDIGCGNGFFLKIAQEQGWKISGTELNPEHCKLLRDQLQCPIYAGAIKTCQIPAQQFDMVRLYHVLEHVHHPFDDILECYRILKPGGILYISVPNTGSWLYKVKDFQSRCRLKSKPYKHYAALHHHWFFTRQTLEKFTNAIGFTTGKIECIVHAKPGKAAGLHAVYAEICRYLGIGQIVDIYARKPVNCR